MPYKKNYGIGKIILKLIMPQNFVKVFMNLSILYQMIMLLKNLIQIEFY